MKHNIIDVVNEEVFDAIKYINENAHNHPGFNPRFTNSVQEFIRERGFVSPKQASALIKIQYRMKKYESGVRHRSQRFSSNADMVHSS